VQEIALLASFTSQFLEQTTNGSFPVYEGAVLDEELSSSIESTLECLERTSGVFFSFIHYVNISTEMVRMIPAHSQLFNFSKFPKLRYNVEPESLKVAFDLFFRVFEIVIVIFIRWL